VSSLIHRTRDGVNLSPGLPTAGDSVRLATNSPELED
jgi:hypothetical protein